MLTPEALGTYLHSQNANYALIRQDVPIRSAQDAAQ